MPQKRQDKFGRKKEAAIAALLAAPKTRTEFEAQQNAHLAEYGEIPKQFIYLKDIDAATGEFVLDVDQDEMIDASSPEHG